MVRLGAIVGIVCLASMAVSAEDQQLSQAELSKKPMYERMLNDQDAKRVAELMNKFDQAVLAGRLEDAILLRQNVLDFRSQRQGVDHWEVANDQLCLKMLSRLDVGGLSELLIATKANRDGLELHEKARFVESYHLFQKSLDICLRCLGEDDPTTACSIDNLASSLQDMGKFDQAREYYQRAFEIRQRMLGPNHPDTATSCNNMALNLQAMGKATEALPMGRNALEIRRRVLGENNPLTAGSFTTLAYILDTLGKADEALPLHQKSLEIRIRVFGKQHLATANSYSNLASNLEAQGKFAEANVLFKHALDIHRRTNGEQHPMTADSYNNLATNLHALGKIEEAQPMLKVALDIRRKALGEDHPKTLESYGNLAAILYLGGDNTAAQAIFQKVLDLRRQRLGEHHPDTIASYDSLAMSLQAEGKHSEAQPFFEKALSGYRQVWGELHRDTARSYNNFALNLYGQGRIAESRLLFEQALLINRKVSGEEHSETARLLNNLGMLMQAQGRASEARPLLQKALDIRRATLGEENPDTASSYNNVAMNLHIQGLFTDSQPLLRKAMEIRLRTLGTNHNDTAASYSNLAANLIGQQQFDEAEQLLVMALAIRHRIFGDTHPDTAASYSNLAAILVRQQKFSEAVSILRRAIMSAETSRINRANGIERAIGEELSPRLMLATQEIIRDPFDAWSQFEFSVARGLLDQQTGEGATLLPAEPGTKENLQAELRKLLPRIAVLASQSERMPNQQAELDDLVQTRNELELRLSELSASTSQRAVATNACIQSVIPRRAALLFWIDMSAMGCVEEHFACVVRHEGEPLWVRLPGTGEQANWIKEDSQLPVNLRQALAQPKPPRNLPDQIQQLRRQRLAPVLKHLQQHGVTQLLVVGVNSMAGLPVEVLAPEFAISYLPSGTFLARLPEKPKFDQTFFALADPLYEVERTTQTELTALPTHGLLIRNVIPTGVCAKAGIRPGDVLLQFGSVKLEQLDQLRPAIEKATAAGDKLVSVTVWRASQDNNTSEKTISLPVGPLGIALDKEPGPVALFKGRKTEAMLNNVRGGENWKDLPATRFEVDRISQLFPSAKVLVDSQASERNVEVLRVAGELGKFRYLHFATHGKGNNTIAFESKLVLSQDAATDEFPTPGQPWMNNEISAREVLEHWKLTADLVTLSACETGLGQQGGGDGLLGFAQAFLVSGARSVCLSLWEVDDTATALLMQRFYQNLLGKRPGLSQPMRKVEALREAKDWLRNLSTKDALAATAMLTGGVSRGSRGEIKITERLKQDRPDDKPYADPHYWSAFILIGDPE